MCEHYCNLPATKIGTWRESDFLNAILAQQELEGKNPDQEVINASVLPEVLEIEENPSDSLSTQISLLVESLLKEEQALSRGTGKNKKLLHRQFMQKASSSLTTCLRVPDLKKPNKTVILNELKAQGLLTDTLRTRIEQIFLFPKIAKSKMN
jgi:hypothetical protein